MARRRENFWTMGPFPPAIVLIISSWARKIRSPAGVQRREAAHQARRARPLAFLHRSSCSHDDERASERARPRRFTRSVSLCAFSRRRHVRLPYGVVSAVHTSYASALLLSLADRRWRDRIACRQSLWSSASFPGARAVTSGRTNGAGFFFSSFSLGILFREPFSCILYTEQERTNAVIAPPSPQYVPSRGRVEGPIPSTAFSFTRSVPARQEATFRGPRNEREKRKKKKRRGGNIRRKEANKHR